MSVFKVKNRLSGGHTFIVSANDKSEVWEALTHEMSINTLSYSWNDLTGDRSAFAITEISSSEIEMDAPKVLESW